MSDEKVESQINASGVKNVKGNPMGFAYDQGEKKMDYGVQGIESGDLNANTFYVRGNTAYNVGDIGNYLWGRGMAELGISLGTASIGAHVNNMLFGWSQKISHYDFGPGTYGSSGVFDAISDQRAIDAGHKSSPRHNELIKKMISSWPKYNPK